MQSQIEEIRAMILSEITVNKSTEDCGICWETKENILSNGGKIV